MSTRAYCSQPHPGSDQEADRYCQMNHRVKVPGTCSHVSESGRPCGKALIAWHGRVTCKRGHEQ